eukprot:s73_g10.t1
MSSCEASTRQDLSLAQQTCSVPCAQRVQHVDEMKSERATTQTFQILNTTSAIFDDDDEGFVSFQSGGHYQNGDDSAGSEHRSKGFLVALLVLNLYFDSSVALWQNVYKDAQLSRDGPNCEAVHDWVFKNREGFAARANKTFHAAPGCPASIVEGLKKPQLSQQASLLFRRLSVSEEVMREDRLCSWQAVVSLPTARLKCKPQGFTKGCALSFQATCLELVKECFHIGRLLKFSAVGIMFGCGAVFSFLAQDALSPGSYALYAQSGVVVVPIIWRLMFRKPLAVLTWIHIGVIAIGIVAYRVSEIDLDHLFDGIGLLWVLLKVLMAGLGSVIAELLLKQDTSLPFTVQVACILPSKALACLLTIWLIPGPDMEWPNHLPDRLQRVALPAAFLRWSIPPNEPVVATQLLATFVGAVALIDRHFREAGQLQHFELSVFGFVFSYVLMLSHRGPIMSVISAFAAALAGACFVTLVVRVNMQVQSLCFVSGLCTAWVGMKLFKRRVLPGAAIGFFCGMFLLPLAMEQLFPVEEFQAAFEVIEEFLPSLRKDALELMVITFQTQVALGYLGVAFIQSAQVRKNLLLTVDRRHETPTSAAHFARHAIGFMAFVAIPYMLERTLMENVGHYTFAIFANKVERSLRIQNLINSVVASTFDIIKREIFSLPKLAFLPGILISNPLLVLLLLHANIGLDFARAKVIGHLNGRIEILRRNIQDLGSRRSEVEQHDTNSAEALLRVGATHIAEAQWRKITLQLQEMTLRYQVLNLFRGFIDHLYKLDIVVPGIECAMAYLLQFQAITAADIWVFTRVVEDAMLFVLENLKSNVRRLRALSENLAAHANRTRHTCNVAKSEGTRFQEKQKDLGDHGVRLQNFTYRRGHVRVRFKDMVLRAGKVYAITGANGCGKSTFFALLASCGHFSAALPPGMSEVDKDWEDGSLPLLDNSGVMRGIALPSDDIVEISQQMYCPLYIEPMTWLQRHVAGREESPQIPQLLSELDFAKESSGGLRDFHSLETNWYGKLSGGQRSKAELISQVFLRHRCPDILLIDEALAPLDADSKILVQRKLKSFCNESVLLVIHHLDSHSQCVSSGGFFDDNLHFENGTASLIGTCQPGREHEAFSQQREQLRRQSDAMAAETAAQNGKALKPEPTGVKEGGKNATATPKKHGHHSNQNDKLVQEAMIPLGAFAVGLLLYLFQQIIPAVLAVYFGAQAGFSLYMKVVLSNTTISQELNIDGIPAGFLVTAIQQVVAFIVLLVVVAVLYVTPYRYTPRRLNSWSEVFCVLLFSLAFSANIGLNNFSLSLLAVSLNMIIRSCLPLVTLIFQQILGPCIPDLATSVRIAEVVLMVAGVVFAALATLAKSHGSHSSESKHLGLGVFVCSLSDVACAVNLILASVFGSVLKPALNPVDTIFYMAVPCAICLIPASIWVYHPVDWPNFGELSDTQVLKKVMELSPNTVLWVVLSGVIAAGYNVLQYTVVQKLSASHAAFAGNFNKAATILLSICMGLESLPGGFWTAVGFQVGFLSSLSLDDLDQAPRESDVVSNYRQHWSLHKLQHVEIQRESLETSRERICSCQVLEHQPRST